MTTYLSHQSIASDEYAYHAHRMPDGNYSPLHNHAGGDKIHEHQVIQTPDGGWAFDYYNDPILGNIQHHQYIPMSAPQQIPVNPIPQQTGACGKAAVVNRDADLDFDPDHLMKKSDEKHSKADTIWDLLKQAAKQ